MAYFTINNGAIVLRNHFIHMQNAAENAHESFDDWLNRVCNPAPNFTFAQYARYIEGWRASKPWAYSGMSVAYDYWAEQRWDENPSQSDLRLAWQQGMALRAKSILQGEPSWCRHATPEECADFALTIPGTFVALVGMGNEVLAEQQPGLFA